MGIRIFRRQLATHVPPLAEADVVLGLSKLAKLAKLAGAAACIALGQSCQVSGGRWGQAWS